MNILDRLRHGPVQESGDWDEMTAREYRNEIYPEASVDIEIERFYGPPTGGGMKMDEVTEEDMLGREALDTVDEYIEDEISFDIEPDEVLTEYEHRARGDDDVLTVEGGYSFIGHQNLYRVTFEF